MTNYHTYFVSYVLTENNNIKLMTGVFGTESSGVQLARDAIQFVDQECPGATLISISKLD